MEVYRPEGMKNNKYALKLQVKQQILNNKLNDKLYRMCDRIGPRHKASMCPMPKALFYILAYWNYPCVLKMPESYNPF